MTIDLKTLTKNAKSLDGQGTGTTSMYYRPILQSAATQAH